MRGSWQRWWLVGKVVLTVVILACVGWQFARILLDTELWHADWHVRPDWALAAGLLYLLAPAELSFGALDEGGLRWQALGFVAVVGILLIPAVFNRLAGRLASAFPDSSTVPPPRLKSATLAEGLAVTACGWALQGASLW